MKSEVLKGTLLAAYLLPQNFKYRLKRESLKIITCNSHINTTTTNNTTILLMWSFSSGMERTAEM